MKQLAIVIGIAFAAIVSPLSASAASTDLWGQCKGPDSEAAVRACTAILDSPDSRLAAAQALYNRARAWLDLEQFDRAIADLDQSVALSPRSPAPRLQRGITLAWKKDFMKAAAEFSAVIALAPKSPTGYLERGKVLIWLGQFDHAVNDLTRAIALDPKRPAAYEARAIAYGHLQDLDRAKSDLARVKALQARSGRVLQASFEAPTGPGR